MLLSFQVKSVEGELSAEIKKNTEIQKLQAKAEKRAKDLQAQLDDEQKSSQVLQDQMVQLNAKVKKLREGLGEAVSLQAETSRVKNLSHEFFFLI